MDQFDDQLFGEEVEPTTVSPTLLNKIKEKNKKLSGTQGESSKLQDFLPSKRGIQNPLAEKEEDESQSKKYYGKEKSVATTKYCSDYDMFLGHRKDKTTSHKIKVLQPEDTFQCRKCANSASKEPCQLCKGKNIIDGNSNMLKFMQFITNFKLGLQESYEPRNSHIYKSQIRGMTSVANPRDSIYYSTVRAPSFSGIRQERQSIQDGGGFLSYQRQKEQNFSGKTIHLYHQCDHCNITPIVGIRYHCDSSECENDYDLCQDCYNRTNHRHEMQKIEGNKREEKIRAYLDSVNKLFAPENRNQRKTMGVASKEVRTGKVQYLTTTDGKNPKIFSSSIH